MRDAGWVVKRRLTAGTVTVSGAGAAGVGTGVGEGVDWLAEGNMAGAAGAAA